MRRLLNFILKLDKIYLYLVKPKYYGKAEYKFFNKIVFTLPYNKFMIKDGTLTFYKILPKGVLVNCTYKYEEKLL